MISPGFLGYYIAQRGIMAHQMAMNVVNNNITNANTDGYSRQRLDLNQASPLTPGDVSLGQVGQGVEVQGITRSADNFLDNQVRTQLSARDYQGSLSDALKQVETIINEPSDSGISNAMTKFFNSAQALSIRPEDLALRNNFLQNGGNMLRTFQDMARRLQDYRNFLVGDPTVTGSTATSKAAVGVASVNNHLQSIFDLNKQILTLSASGGTANALLDERAKLLEEISKQVNITVDNLPNDQINVRIGNTYLIQGQTLQNTLIAAPNTNPATQVNNPIIIQASTGPTDITADITSGELGGILKVGGNGASPTTIRGMLEKLNTLFTEIANRVNNLQANGRDLAGNQHNTVGDPAATIFSLPGTYTGLAIHQYTVNSNIIANPALNLCCRCSGAFAGVGDGRNMQAMAAIARTTLAGFNNTSPSDFFSSTVSVMGSDASAANDSYDNLKLVAEQVNGRRQSIVGVNIEEEMIDLMRFQRGFEASARVMSTVDKVMDLLINRLT